MILNFPTIFVFSTLCKIGNPLPPCDSNANSSDSEPEEEVLITVQTVHIPVGSETDKSLVTATNRMGTKFCFICNAPETESAVKVFGTVSTHSKKPIFNIIWKIMDGKPSVRYETADASSMSDELICMECFEMVSSYDANKTSAKKLKKKIRQKLSITELYYEQAMSTPQSKDEGVEDDTDEQEQQHQEHQQSDVGMMENTACEVIDLCGDD